MSKAVGHKVKIIMGMANRKVIAARTPSIAVIILDFSVYGEGRRLAICSLYDIGNSFHKRELLMSVYHPSAKKSSYPYKNHSILLRITVEPGIVSLYPQ